MKKKELLKRIELLNRRVENQQTEMYRALTILCDKLKVAYEIEMDGTYIDGVNIDDDKEWQKYKLKRFESIIETSNKLFENRG